MGTLKKYVFGKSKILYKSVKIMAVAFGGGSTIKYSEDYINFLNGQSFSANSICFSNELKYIGIGGTTGLNFSSNGGKTFVMKSIGDSQRCSMNSSGQYIIAAGNSSFIKQSSDYGNTWNNRKVSQSWRGSSISSDGKYQIVCGYSGTYLALSSDFGVTWSDLTTATAQSWYSVAISDNGQYILAKPYGATARVSSDFGATWTNKTAYGTGNETGCAMSASGQYQTFASTGSNIYVSSDYGVTFTKELIIGVKNFSSVAMSASGQFQTVVVNGDYIYVSVDYGVTWTQRGSSAMYQSVYVKRN